MSRKHSRPSNASLDNINVGIFADEVDASTIENPPKRKKGNNTQATLLKKVRERKDLLFLEYQDIFRKQKEGDKAWKWLSDLGIPCHNMLIPVVPHTKPQVRKGTTNAEGGLKEINCDEVYCAHDITPEIISRYCGWKIRGSLPPFVNEPDRTLCTYRNVARKTTFGDSEGRPSYLMPPHRTNPRKSIERDVLPVIRAAALKLRLPTLIIPLEWKTISEPALWSLPWLYDQKLAHLEELSRRVPEAERELLSERESSRPLDEIEESHLLNKLKNSIKNDIPSSVSAQRRLELIQTCFPIGEDQPTEITFENAQRAERLVNKLNRYLSLDSPRREVARKLDVERFLSVKAVVFMSRDDIVDLDDSCGLGSVLVNDNPPAPECQTAAIIEKWGIQPPGPGSNKEMGDERAVGGLLNKLIMSDEINITDDEHLLLPTCLQMAGMRPRPDLLSQAKEIASCPRLSAFLPVLFAAECKRNKGVTRNTPAQLACALNGTLVLLVLMYLDMRKTTEDPLPDWLFVYGIIYTGSGVVIRAHFPTYRYAGENEPSTDTESDDGVQRSRNELSEVAKQRQTAVNSGLPRWIFKSVEVTTRYSAAFEAGRDSERLRLLAALLMIRSHSLLLLEKFKSWAAHSPDTSALSAFHSVVNSLEK